MTDEPPTEDARDLRVELHYAIEKLGVTFGWSERELKRTTTLVKFLSTNACERRIGYYLSNPDPDGQKFDPFYREKSEYATLKILDHLKRRLTEEGFATSLAEEVKDDFGVYDVTIVKTDPCMILREGEQVARLEIKASLGVPLEQIDRYLWGVSPLILVRVITGQVALLRPRELHDYVEFSTMDLVQKAKRMSEGKGYTIPGRYCWTCPDAACQFGRKRRVTNARMVKMDDSEFGEDLTFFFKNLPHVAERTSRLVIQELRSSTAGVAP